MTTTKPTTTPAVPWYKVYAKAVVAGLYAGVAAAGGALVPALIAGAPPTGPQWWTALGLGLAAGGAAALHVAKTKNA